MKKIHYAVVHIYDSDTYRKIARQPVGPFETSKSRDHWMHTHRVTRLDDVEIIEGESPEKDFDLMVKPSKFNLDDIIDKAHEKQT